MMFNVHWQLFMCVFRTIWCIHYTEMVRIYRMARVALEEPSLACDD